MGNTAEGVFYNAMELLSGATLRDIVERTGPFPAGRAIHVLAQCCGALQEAHNKGILHRDIKAANIMLSEQAVHFALSRRVYNVLMISLTCRRSWSNEKTMFLMIFACNFG